MFKFSKASLSKLEKVDIKLKLLAEEVLKISPYDFTIIDGFRTTEEQQELFRNGKSKCDVIKNRSKHQNGKAIDIMIYGKNGIATWEKKYYVIVAEIFKKVANEMKINIRWGGDFKGFFDGVHFEL